jgi:hypothetical protein
MISFFPQMYEDEILYSVIARYHKFSANSQITDSVRDLFGVNRVRATVALNRRLGFLAEQTKIFGVSFEDLLINHTFFPVYSVFQTQGTIDKTIDWALSDTSYNPYSALGITYKDSKPIAHLRFCPQCLCQEKSLYGEGYWHRTHQMIGVLMCEKHGCLLCESDVPMSSSEYNNYVCIEDARICTEEKGIILNSREQDLAIKISQNYNLLYSYYNEVREQHLRDIGFKRTYLFGLKEKGYTTPNHCIRNQNLKDDFIEFFGTLLDVLNMGFSTSTSVAWPIKMYRQDPTKKSNVIRHILFSLFLFDGLPRVVQNCREDRTCQREKIHYSPPIMFEQKLNRYRPEWLREVKENPDKSTEEIRKQCTPIYTWLNRHDKEWLDQKKPSSQKRIQKKSTKDWKKIDQIITDSIEAIVEDIARSNQRPKRITKEKIANATGYHSYLTRNKYRTRLPKTMAILQKHTETRDEYRKRKISWASNELIREGMKITKYKLMRKAGIPDDMTPDYWKYYQNVVAGLSDSN